MMIVVEDAPVGGSGRASEVAAHRIHRVQYAQ